MKWASHPWVSWLALGACIAIFLGISLQADRESLETLARFGYLPADAVWDGGYWALVTSAFVHLEIWHFAFNAYWLWVLGSRLERAVGSLRYLLFVVLAAFVSSSLQLAVSGDTGLGASGVVYALFGFMWPTRFRYPGFDDVVNKSTVQLFLIWLVVCIVATLLDVWNVGNAAHISGLLFGMAVAGSFALRDRPWLSRAGLTALVALAVVPLFWSPWSVDWLSHQAFQAHVEKRYDDAIEGYSRVLERDPENAWAYLNRGHVYLMRNDFPKAGADLQKAYELDPALAGADAQ